MPLFAKIHPETNEFMWNEFHDEMPDGYTAQLPTIISPKPLLYDWDNNTYIDQASEEERQAHARKLELRDNYAVGFRYDDTITGMETSEELNELFPEANRNFILYATVPQKSFTKLLNGQWSGPVDFV